METPAIKSCPHCGGAAYLNQTYSGYMRKYFAFVKCSFCGAQGKAYRSKEEPAENDWATDSCFDAIEAWNKRYTGGNSENE